jgi:hypothetical protein
VVGLPEPQDARIRVRRVVAPTLDQLEGVTNTALSELQEAGQRIISVQFEIPQDTARRTSAFIIYDDRVGIGTDHDERQSEVISQRQSALISQQNQQWADQVQEHHEARDAKPPAE